MQLPPQLSRIWQMVVHAKAVFFSPTTPLYVKFVLALGVLYVLSPYDLIPEWVPVLGVMDDLALIALLIAWANGFSSTDRK
ncbi:MAG: YkvA family protein [Desulfobulbus sp.]